MALNDLGQVRNDFARVYAYAELRYSVDSRDAATKDLIDTCLKAYESVENSLRFFDLEWQTLNPERAAALTAEPEVTPFRHYLEKLTAYAPHMRTGPEEEMLAAREASAVAEWQKLFADNIAKIEVDFEGPSGAEPHTLDRLLAYSRSPSREMRFKAYELVYEQLAPRAEVQAACYNSLVGDRLQIDRVRGFAAPMQQANLANDLPDSVVDDLLRSVQEQYPLARRWFVAKSQLVGLPKLHLYDQYAPLGSPGALTFQDAFDMLGTVTMGFSPRVNEIIGSFVSDQRVDAEPRVAKRGGAFCAPVAWGDDPYILTNFTDDVGSGETLAHEVGHGLHFVLSGQKQVPAVAGTGMAMAEVASTFLQALFVDHSLERAADSDERRAIIARQIESFCAVVFRQVMMTSYEQRAYDMKSSGMALTADRLSDIWLEENQKYYGDSIEIPDSYRWGWAYIPHFIDTRFYTYAYSFAHLASLAIYARYREEGESFVPKFLDILAAGGSESPQTLLLNAGIDTSNPDWVSAGFAEMGRLLDSLGA